MSEFLESLDISKLNEYQMNKRNWLVESHYPAERTNITYWRALEDNRINFLEKAKGKDLYDFSTLEIVEAINYAPTIKMSSKLVLKTVMTKYNQWALDRGHNPTGINPCDGIDNKDLKVNMTAFEMSYVDLDYFYDVLKVVQASDVDKMILVMARYGIKTKDMAYIRWEDVDRENKTVSLFYGYNKPLILPVDDRFIEWVDKAKDEEGYKREGKSIEVTGKTVKVKYKRIQKEVSTEYEDYGYILKVTEKAKGEAIVKENTIRNRVYEMSKVKTIDDKHMKRPNVRDYNISRRYDLLFDILDMNGKVTTNDIRKVIGVFEESVTSNKMSHLKVNFELISGQEVETRLTENKEKTRG